MHTNRRLIVNTALMTGSSIVMRCIGLIFQAWIVGRIGAAGIGLYQLVMSVSVLFATFAISGIRFATTRLISEEMGLERGAGVTGAMRRCACYALFFGLCAGTMVYFLAEPVGFLWIGDARTVRSLRITSISLPCIALSSVMDGYFTASGRVWKPTLVHLLEQLVSITCVMWFLSFAAAGDLEQSCAAVTAGGACADVVSLLLMTAMYALDRRKYRRGGDTVPHLTRRMLAVALPLAVSAYARTSLTTLEHLLIPRGLKSAGLTADRALAGYGIVHGMALPVVLFPSCLLYALADLLVPELTTAQVSGRCGDIRRLVRTLLAVCVRHGRAAAGVFRAARTADLPFGRRGALHPAARAARAGDVSRHRDRRLSARARPADTLHGHQRVRRHTRRGARVGAAAAVRVGGVSLHFVFQ